MSSLGNSFIMILGVLMGETSWKMVQHAFQVFFRCYLTFSYSCLSLPTSSSHTCKIGFLCVFSCNFWDGCRTLAGPEFDMWLVSLVYHLESWVGQLKVLFFVWTFASFFIFTVNHSHVLSGIQISNRYIGFLFAASVHSILLNLLFALSSAWLSESWLTSAPIFIELLLKFTADTSSAKSRENCLEEYFAPHTNRSQNNMHINTQTQNRAYTNEWMN